MNQWSITYLKNELFCIIFLSIFLSVPVKGTDSKNFFKKAEPLVLKFKQNKTPLSEAILGFCIDDQLFLPLEELSAGIGFAINVDMANHRADGFYLKSGNEFYLDMKTGIVKSVGQSFNIKNGSVILGDYDLYIALSSLNRWFNNVSFEFNKNYLIVEVYSNPLLPATQQRIREETRGNVALNRGGKRKQSFPEAVAEYKLFRMPFIDVNIDSSWSKDNGSSTSASLRGVHDVLGLGTKWFISLDQEEMLENARVVFSSRDPKSELLAPFNLSEFEAGDIGQDSVPLIGGQRGAGINFTTRTQDVTRGTKTELRGELPKGWEAELYHNNILTAFVSEPENGEYVFSDIPLQAGSNRLKVVLYGPQGQREEIHKTIRIGGDQPAPGKFYADASILMQGKNTIPVSEWFDSDDSDITEEDQDIGEIASSIRCALGVTPGFSLAANGVTMSIDGKRRNFLSLSTEFPRFVTDFAIDDGKGRALGTRFIKNIAGLNILLQHKEFYNGFSSPVNSSDTETTIRSSELRTNGKCNILLPFNIMFKTKYENFLNAEPETEAELGLSTYIGPIQINNQVNGTFKNNNDNDFRLEDIEGKFNLSFRNRRFTFRKRLSYIIKPEPKLESLSVNCTMPFLQEKLKMNMTVGHNFEGGTSVGLGMGLKTNMGEFFTQINSDFETRTVSANFGMSFSLNWINGGALPSIDRKPMTSQGVVNAKVFIDKDSDGLNSIGDEPLAGISFKPGRAEEKSDKNGSITLSRLSVFTPTDVTIKEETLPDPFLRPTIKGYNVTARPGAPVDISFPVVWVSDIEGMVLLTENLVTKDGVPIGPAVRGLGNVKILVLDKDGNVARRVNSEFDGFFAVPALPSGKYKLVIDPDQAARFHLEDNGGTEFTLRDDTSILLGVELNLTALEPVVSE